MVEADDDVVRACLLRGARTGPDHTTVTVWTAAAAALVMFVGAAVQGSVGFGLNLVAAPLLVLIDPAFVPTPVILASFLLNLLVVRRERDVDPGLWRSLRWPIAAAIPGSIAGAAVVSVVHAEGLSLVAGVVVLIAVALVASGRHPARTPLSLTVAGLVSGFMGTAVGIGGPPIALLYSTSTGAEIRGALSRFFLVAGIISLVLLAAFGQLTTDDLGRAAILLPGIALGYVTSSWLAHHVQRSHVRVAVLGLSAISGVLAIVRALA